MMKEDSALSTMFNVISRGLYAHLTRRSRHGDLVEGDIVTKEIRAPVFDPKEKFGAKCVELYIIKIILSKGAAKLIDLDDSDFTNLVNLDQLKRYYP